MVTPLFNSSNNSIPTTKVDPVTTGSTVAPLFGTTSNKAENQNRSAPPIPVVVPVAPVVTPAQPKVVAPPSTVNPLTFKEQKPLVVNADSLFEGNRSNGQILKDKLAKEITLKKDLDFLVEFCLELSKQGYAFFYKKFTEWGSENQKLQKQFSAITVQWTGFEAAGLVEDILSHINGNNDGFFARLAKKEVPLKELEARAKFMCATRDNTFRKIGEIRDSYEKITSEICFVVQALTILDDTDIPDRSRILNMVLPFQASLLMTPAELQLFQQNAEPLFDQVDQLVYTALPQYKRERNITD